jgi:hypothetical protein
MEEKATSDEIVIPDMVPPVSDVDNPCASCGREIDVVYGGRGRRPTKCSTCKGSKKNTTPSSLKGNSGNEKLAAQATEALCSIDGMLELGAKIVGLTDTADAIAEADEVFRIRVNMALVNSPDTCRRILRYGSKAGDSALFIAIALHIATIVPVLKNEVSRKRAEKAALEAEQELENASRT